MTTSLKENADLIHALRLLTRWVAKGIADGAYAECVAPRRAERDLAIAEELLARLDGPARPTHDGVLFLDSAGDMHVLAPTESNRCDGCGKMRRDVQSVGRDCNGEPDAPDLCFLCRKAESRP